MSTRGELVAPGPVVTCGTEPRSSSLRDRADAWLDQRAPRRIRYMTSSARVALLPSSDRAQIAGLDQRVEVRGDASWHVAFADYEAEFDVLGPIRAVGARLIPSRLRAIMRSGLAWRRSPRRSPR